MTKWESEQCTLCQVVEQEESKITYSLHQVVITILNNTSLKKFLQIIERKKRSQEAGVFPIATK